MPRRRRRSSVSYGEEWPGIRLQVFERDGRECSCCGRPQSRRLRLQIHHIVPYARVKTHELENLAVCCIRCHRAVHLAYRQHFCETARQFFVVFQKVQRTTRENEARKHRVSATKRRAPEPIQKLS